MADQGSEVLADAVTSAELPGALQCPSIFDQVKIRVADKLPTGPLQFLHDYS